MAPGRGSGAGSGANDKPSQRRRGGRRAADAFAANVCAVGGEDDLSLDQCGQDELTALVGRNFQLKTALAEAAAIVDVLRAAESRARTAMEALPAAVAYADPAGGLRFCNAYWRQWLDPAAQSAALDAALKSVVAKGSAELTLTGVAGADGRARHVSFHFSRHADSKGDPEGAGEGVSVVGIDVTDQMEAERALRDREEMSALAMRGPNEGLWDWNPITKELRLSARLLAILGFEGDTLRTTSHEWLKLVHPDDRRRYEATVASHLKGLSEHFECEYRVLDRTGNYRWMLARGLAQRGGDGLCRRMVGSIGDITDLKRREQAARANEARFRALVGMSGAIFLVVDRHGRIQEANREAERALGGEDQELVDTPWRAWMDADSAAAFAERLTAAMSGRAARGFEHRFKSPLGDERVLLWNIDRFDAWGAGGYEILLICAGQDITLRKQAEDALLQANEELERKVAARTAALTQEVAERRRAEAALIDAKEQAEVANRAKSEFLANMSHELRTPLNAVIGFAEMTAAQMVGPIGNPKYAEYANLIAQSAYHLLAVIGDVLDLAKIEAGHFRIDPGLVSLAEVADSSLALVAERARAGDVRLAADYEDDLPFVWGDAVRIKQILLNLLSNAVKFTPEGREVRVGLRRDGAGAVAVEVADQGCGMSAAELAVALEPFGQVDNQMSRRAGGTGLGLPLSRRFVELHGGRFEIETAPGCGAVVRVTFPIAPEGGPAVCLLSEK